MSSSISEAFLKNTLSKDPNPGLNIPYEGYAEFDVEEWGGWFQKGEFLIVKNSSSPHLLPKVPGVPGMNIIRECYTELFSEYGPGLFEVTQVQQTPELWKQALQYCQRVPTKPSSPRTNVAKARGRRSICISGGTFKVVAATCCQHLMGLSSSILFEPLGRADALPAGLLVSPVMVQVHRLTVYIPIVNEGATSVVLPLHCTLGLLSPVGVMSLPPGVREVCSLETELEVNLNVQTQDSARCLFPASH